jgi:hypothetical protein
MSDTLAVGWGALELAEERARKALASWDSHRNSPALYLHRAMALAETTRKLLAELDAERRARAAR